MILTDVRFISLNVIIAGVHDKSALTDNSIILFMSISVHTSDYEAYFIHLQVKSWFSY